MFNEIRDYIQKQLRLCKWKKYLNMNKSSYQINGTLQTCYALFIKRGSCFYGYSSPICQVYGFSSDTCRDLIELFGFR